MFINYLKVFKGNEIIRDIPFHNGVNFIVDDTPYTRGTDSGNNVGKTTLLRLIDYCLGSDGKDIYADTEFTNNKNNDLKIYLEENNFLIELSLLDEKNVEVVIARNFLSRKNKLITINDEIVNDTELKNYLNQLLFGNIDSKPSFRNLISKFIRNTPHRMSRTLKYLHNTTTDSLYESVHLFLLGIDVNTEVIEEKSWLETKIKTEKDVYNRITEDGNNESALKQALIVINRDIKNLESRKADFNIGKSEEAEINELNDIKFLISKIASKIGENETRLKLIDEAVDELRNNMSLYDTEAIRDIYNEVVLIR